MWFLLSLWAMSSKFICKIMKPLTPTIIDFVYSFGSVNYFIGSKSKETYTPWSHPTMHGTLEFYNDFAWSRCKVGNT